MSFGRLGKMVINIRAPRRGTFMFISSSVHGCETWSVIKKKEDFCDGAGENNRNCKNGSNRTEKIKKLNT